MFSTDEVVYGKRQLSAPMVTGLGSTMSSSSVGKALLRKKMSPFWFRGRGGAEGDGRVHALGRAIHPAAFGAVERQFLAVQGEEVLAKKLAQVFKEITKAADHGVVSADRMLGLGDVHQVHHQHREHARDHKKRQDQGARLDDRLGNAM